MMLGLLLGRLGGAGKPPIPPAPATAIRNASGGYVRNASGGYVLRSYT